MLTVRKLAHSVLGLSAFGGGTITLQRHWGGRR